MPKLVIKSGAGGAREFELKPGMNYVGRGFANDLKIEDPSVSSNHAQIILDGETAFIKDLGSTNGTFINGASVKEAALRAGETLRLGGVNLDFYTETAVAAVVPASSASAAAASAARAPDAYRGRPSPAAPAPARLGPAPTLPPPTPVATAAAAKPPPAKTVCKFHPKVPGQWLCQKCNELFCSACVSTSRTGGATNFLCRKCGTVCVPVKVNLAVAKAKQPVHYSDGVLLGRCLGFGFAAAVVSALIWIGISSLIGFDVPFLFCPLAGALCGYAVKLGSQDRPGPVFSSIAIGCCILGTVVGKVGMIMVTHLTLNSATSLLTAGLGLVLGIFLAWKLGGGDI